MSLYFCDGSQRGMGIGVGIVKVDDLGFLEVFHEEKIHPHASPLLAECFAIYQALALAEKHQEERVEISTDSLELVQFLKHTRIYKDNEFTALFEPTKRKTIPLMDKLKSRIVYFYTVKKMKEISIHHYDKHETTWAPYMNIAHMASREHIRTLPAFFLNEADRAKIETHLSKATLNKCSLYSEDATYISEDEFTKESKPIFTTHPPIPTQALTIEANTIYSGKQSKKWQVLISCSKQGIDVEQIDKSLPVALYAAIHQHPFSPKTHVWFVQKRIIKILQAVNQENKNEDIQSKTTFLLSILQELPEEHHLDPVANTELSEDTELETVDTSS